MTAMSRHGLYAEGTTKYQIALQQELLDAARERAGELGEAWDEAIPVSAVFRQALREYLAKPVPRRKPLGFDGREA